MTDPTNIAEHWAHFASVDIHPDAPQAQRNEMERAFMAGAISAVHLFALCVTHKDYAERISDLAAELEAWNVSWNARKGVERSE